MLGLLEAAKVPMRKLTPNAKHIHSLRQKLQSLLAERSELKYTAQRAFVSYVRSVALQGEKAVFDAKALPLQALAESMGLLAPPRVRFLSATQAKSEGKSWATSSAGGAIDSDGVADEDEDDEGASEVEGGASEEEASSAEEGASDDDDEEEEEQDDDEDEDDEDDDEGLVLGRKAKKKQPRNKLKRLLLRNTAERRGELTGAAARTLSEKTPSLRPDATATEAGDGDGS